MEFLNSAGNHIKSMAATVDMPYTDGNILRYKGIAGPYSTVVTDVPAGSKTTTFTFSGCTDSDGNHYATVRIGAGKAAAQTWMAENLNVEAWIPLSQPQTDNGITEKFCYNGYDYNCSIYGGLYQWHEMMQYVDNECGFSALPAGWFDSVFANGFSNLGGLTYFWTSLSKSGFFIDFYYLELSYNWYFVSVLKDPPVSVGYSVRCIKN